MKGVVKMKNLRVGMLACAAILSATVAVAAVNLGVLEQPVRVDVPTDNGAAIWTNNTPHPITVIAFEASKLSVTDALTATASIEQGQVTNTFSISCVNRTGSNTNPGAFGVIDTGGVARISGATGTGGVFRIRGKTPVKITDPN